MAYLTSYQLRGDPGLFGSLFGGIKGAVGGLLRGGPLGAITGGIGGVLGGGRTAPAMPRIASITQQRQMPRPGVVAAVQRAVPGGQTGMQPIPRGYRYNKSGYYTKDGQYHAPGTRLVRTRRRNPANARALRRALSRAEAFGGIVKRVRKTTRKLRTL